MAIGYTNSSSPAHNYLSRAEQDQAKGNISTEEISWYVPTRNAKMFHPRSLGQQAMAILVMQAW